MFPNSHGRCWFFPFGSASHPAPAPSAAPPPRRPGSPPPCRTPRGEARGDARRCFPGGCLRGAGTRKPGKTEKARKAGKKGTRRKRRKQKRFYKKNHQETNKIYQTNPTNPFAFLFVWRVVKNAWLRRTRHVPRSWIRATSVRLERFGVESDAVNVPSPETPSVGNLSTNFPRGPWRFKASQPGHLHRNRMTKLFAKQLPPCKPQKQKAEIWGGKQKTK